LDQLYFVNVKYATVSLFVAGSDIFVEQWRYFTFCPTKFCFVKACNPLKPEGTVVRVVGTTCLLVTGCSVWCFSCYVYPISYQYFSICYQQNMCTALMKLPFLNDIFVICWGWNIGVFMFIAYTSVYRILQAQSWLSRRCTYCFSNKLLFASLESGLFSACFIWTRQVAWYKS
jgi:hypothetical protein